MAHTDRDDERWHRRNHHRYLCPNAYRIRTWPRMPWASQGCLECDTEPYYRWRYVGTKGKQHWNKAQRRAERTKARQAMRQCRDYDELNIDYRRPWWD